MARPFKDPAQRKSKDLRIPVTEAQKAIVEQAVAALGCEMAKWARQLLLAEAQLVVASKASGRKKTKAHPPTNEA